MLINVIINVRNQKLLTTIDFILILNQGVKWQRAEKYESKQKFKSWRF